MAKKAVILAMLFILVSAGQTALAQVKVGFGGGFTGSPGNGLTLGAIDMFAETRPAAGLSPRFAWSYLPPLFPTEGAALHLELGVRLSVGEVVRPHLALGAGAVFEQGRFCCLHTNPALSAGGGLEFALTARVGLHVRGAVVVAWRYTPYGRATYMYLPWSAGVHLITPALGGPARQREDVGAETGLRP